MGGEAGEGGEGAVAILSVASCYRNQVKLCVGLLGSCATLSVNSAGIKSHLNLKFFRLSL